MDQPFWSFKSRASTLFFEPPTTVIMIFLQRPKAFLLGTVLSALSIFFAPDLFGQVVINEFMAKNDTILADEDGAFSDWIELYNSGGSAVDLGGWTITDNNVIPDKWTFPSISIPSGAYLVIFASGKNRVDPASELHTNFGLSASGEYLGLFNDTGGVQFAYNPDYGLQFADVSYGLDGTSASFPAGYFDIPTPNAENGIGDPTYKAQVPSLSISHGYYNNPFNLSMSSPDGIGIRYTLDGSVPSSSNGIDYIGAFLVDKTSVIRAVATGGGFDDSDAVTSTYVFSSDVLTQSASPIGWPTSPINGQVFDYEMDPVITGDGSASTMITDSFQDISTLSIAIDPDSLFDPLAGIFVNAEERWERSASFELIDLNGGLGFQVNAGLKMRGGESRSDSNPKHSFGLEFKSEFGPSKLEYPLFGVDGSSSFDKLDLKTAQSYSWAFKGDSKNTFLRDITIRDLQGAIGQPYVRSLFHHLFINGVYFGLYMTEERPDATFGSDYLGGQKADYDVLKSAGSSGSYLTEAADGDINGDWKTLWDLTRLQNSSPTQARYMQMQALNPDGTPNPSFPDLLDVDNLIDHMLLSFYFSTFDGPLSWFRSSVAEKGSNNWFGLRDGFRDTRGFKFVQQDAEHSFGVIQDETDQVNRVGPLQISFQGDFSVSNPQYLHQDLTTTTDYVMELADRTYELIFNNGPLTLANVTAAVNTRKAEIENAIVAESARWGDAQREPAYTKADWESAVNDQLSFLTGRANALLAEMRIAGVYPANNPPEFSNSATSYNRFEGPVGAGFQLAIDNTGNSNEGTIYYTIDLSDPRAPGGANQGIDGGDSKTLSISGTMTVNARVLDGGVWSALQTATFYAPQMLDKLVINEIHYHPIDEGIVDTPGYVDGDEFEFLEIKNVSNVTLELQGVHFTDGIGFTFPPGSSIEAGDFVVLAENEVEFENRYGFAPDFKYSDKLKNTGERVALNDFAGTLLDSLTFGDSLPWTSLPDGTGPSLSLDSSAGTNNSSPGQWYPSDSDNGSPGAENTINVGLQLAIKAVLGGAWTGTEMRTDLNSNGFILLDQPYQDVPIITVSTSFFAENPDVVDWVWLELRTTTDPLSFVFREAFLILKDGSLMNTLGSTSLGLFGPGSASYYLVLGHRNHLPIMTALPVSLSMSPTSYDFTSSAGQAFGINAMRNQGGVFALWPGDGNSDRSVSAFDFLQVWLLQNGGAPGYLSGDFDLNANVTAFDFLQAWLPSNGSSSQVP